MTNRNPASEYSNMAEAIRFALEEWTKLNISVCLPGLIESHDPATRRATVQPAIDILLTDGRREVQPAIANVPVVWPAVQGFVMAGALRRGDPVLLVFCQRGLTGFKRTHGRSVPDEDSLFDLRDAVAIPGFGPPPGEPTAPVSTTGIALQDHAGENYIALEPDAIRIRTTGKVTLADMDGTREL